MTKTKRFQYGGDWSTTLPTDLKMQAGVVGFMAQKTAFREQVKGLMREIDEWGGAPTRPVVTDTESQRPVIILPAGQVRGSRKFTRLKLSSVKICGAYGAVAPARKELPRWDKPANLIDQIRAELQRWQQRGVVTRIGHLALRTTASGTELVADIYITDEAWANDVDLELREAIVTLLTDTQDLDLDINPSSRDSAQPRAS